MAVKNLSIRIDQKLLDQLHVVANYEGRSANSQILTLIRENVYQFETQHGAIFEESIPKDQRKSLNRK